MFLRLTLALALLRLPRIVFNILRAAILLIWMMLVGLAAILSRLFSASLDDQVRGLSQTRPQGMMSEGVSCPRCHRLNSSEEEECFACGEELLVSNPNLPNLTDRVFLWGVVAGVVITVLLLVIF